MSLARWDSRRTRHTSNLAVVNLKIDPFRACAAGGAKSNRSLRASGRRIAFQLVRGGILHGESAALPLDPRALALHVCYELPFKRLDHVQSEDAY